MPKKIDVYGLADAEIEAAAGLTIPEIFIQIGAVF